jgi:hypothetical protein
MRPRRWRRTEARPLALPARARRGHGPAVEKQRLAQGLQHRFAPRAVVEFGIVLHLHQPLVLQRRGGIGDLARHARVLREDHQAAGEHVQRRDRQQLVAMRLERAHARAVTLEARARHEPARKGSSRALVSSATTCPSRTRAMGSSTTAPSTRTQPPAM